jgi:hypothetical protein
MTAAPFGVDRLKRDLTAWANILDALAEISLPEIARQIAGTCGLGEEHEFSRIGRHLELFCYRDSHALGPILVSAKVRSSIPRVRL